MTDETVKEEWLLTFTADTDDEFFKTRIRQKVMYTASGDNFPHFAWFETAAQAKLCRAVAEDAGAWDMKLQHRTVTTVSTEWVEVP